MNTPTALATAVTGTTTGRVSSALVAGTLAIPPSFPVALAEDKLQAVQSRVATFNFAQMATGELVQLGQGPTVALNQMLDQVLARINKQENPQVFKLVDTLSQELAKEKIAELSEQILDAKPSLWHRVMGIFSKTALQKGLDNAYEELGRVTRAKSQNLSTFVQKLEHDLQKEMQKLTDELRQIEQVKENYRLLLNDFAAEVLFLNNALSKAQAEMPALLAAVENDVVAQQDLQDRVQALESVALSREAMLTRLPAEQMVIRQVQNAGVSTIQELTVTMGDRFGSIRMTLVALHGANMVRNVQRLGQANANLDSQLQAARGSLMKNVVATAANAPGNNRLEQANNLKQVVENTKELQAIVDASRIENARKFAESRQTMEDTRKDMLELGKVIQPGRAMTF